MFPPVTSSFVLGVVVPMPTLPVPLGLRRMLPVELALEAELPIVRVCLLVVWIFPSPSRESALLPELAEIEAVGVPPATLRKANLALVVAEFPIRRSRVSLIGDRAPLVNLQLELPLPVPLSSALQVSTPPEVVVSAPPLVWAEQSNPGIVIPWPALPRVIVVAVVFPIERVPEDPVSIAPPPWTRRLPLTSSDDAESVVNDPLFGVVIPIDPGDVQVFPKSWLALITPFEAVPPE